MRRKSLIYQGRETETPNFVIGVTKTDLRLIYSLPATAAGTQLRDFHY